jgi:copper chaperone CopZ
MKRSTLIIFLLFFSELALSQKKFEEVIIQTSAQCGDCKERIESKLNYTKGVIFAELELESKKVTVKYKTKFITLLEIKKAIASIGYSADEIKAKEEDVLKLPKCCQPGGH